MRRLLRLRVAGGSESGLTLVELLIAASMGVVITGVAMALLVTALKKQPDVTQRADQVGEARTAVERMVREVRQAVVGKVSVTNTGTTLSQLKLETYVDGNCGSTQVTTASKCAVEYKCEAEVCSRITGTGTTSTTRVISGVKNVGAVFEAITGQSRCTSTATEVISFVEVKLELRSQKGGVTYLQDGASPRSCA